MINPIIKYHQNGNKRSEQYVVNGEFHRDPSQGPAITWYYFNGEIEWEQYAVNGKFHRNTSQGPAIIWYNIHGKIISFSYFLNGKLHNPYGPAYIYYTNNEFTWWLNGINYTKKVNEYIDKNNLNYKNMTQIDFDIMWSCIL